MLPVGIPKALEPLPNPLTTDPDKKYGMLLVDITNLDFASDCQTSNVTSSVNECYFNAS